MEVTRDRVYGQVQRLASRPVAIVVHHNSNANPFSMRWGQVS